MSPPRIRRGFHASAMLALALVALAGAPSTARASLVLAPPKANWVVEENRKEGTEAWRIPAGTPKGIEGYADRVSVGLGRRVQLFVSTRAVTFHVEAYRLGYYKGKGGRLIWQSSEVAGVKQSRRIVDPETNMVETRWSPSLAITVGEGWVEGVYLLKLVSSDGGQSYVPLTVRNDDSHAPLVIQSSVTTWQAYNRWGGYSLYKGADGTFASRSRVVSFDRPYKAARGAGQLSWLEQPLIVLVEKLGLDITYWTDVDLHERSGLLANHNALISLGHDEYWSSAMFDGALAARGLGVNIAFLGGNAVYRHIRFEASPLGDNRRIVCYKVATEDPLYGIDDEEVTANWRTGPAPRPESELLGGLYQCGGLDDDDMVVVEPASWVFAGLGFVDGSILPGVVDLEYDRVHERMPTPDTIMILAHSPVSCGARPDHADVSYYTTRSGAGVIDIGSQGWIPKLACGPPLQGDCVPGAVTITSNILRELSKGPAGVPHPSEPNLDRFGLVLEQPLDV